MARPLRLEYSGALYHITSRGNERKKIYREEQDFKLFLKVLAQVVEDTNWLCHSYCLMPNHYHLLLETPEPNLSKGMRQLNGIYTQKFNYKYKRSGHLFQGRYKAIIVEKEAHLLELCRYIVLNPVRANIVDLPEMWPYSSYLAAIGKVKTPTFLHTDWILAQFARGRNRARAAYKRFVANGGGQASPLSKVVGQIYLGSEAFRAQMEENLQNRVITKEIPITQRHPMRPHIKEILNQVAKAFKVEAGHLLNAGKSTEAREARKVAIYLCRHLGGHDLKTVAEQFGLSYTHVSKLVGMIRDRINSNKNLKNRIKSIEAKIMDKRKT